MRRSYGHALDKPAGKGQKYHLRLWHCKKWWCLISREWLIYSVRVIGTMMGVIVRPVDIRQRLEETEAMKTRAKSLAAAVFFVICATTAGGAADDLQHRTKSAVDMAVRPVMAKYSIPGVAVGITVAGNRYVV